jgi:hypothetical protein
MLSKRAPPVCSSDGVPRSVLDTIFARDRQKSLELTGQRALSVRASRWEEQQYNFVERFSFRWLSEAQVTTFK